MASPRSTVGLAAVLALAMTVSCATAIRDVTPHTVPRAGPMVTRSTGADRPLLSVLARDGDPQGAIAVAVTTDGIAVERGALSGVALAALVEGRLSARRIDATAVGGSTGWHLEALVASPRDSAAVVEGVRDALLRHVVAGEPALELVARRAAALARRPLADPALAGAALCTGEPFALGSPGGPSLAELESWRAAAHGLGRVAIAAVGSDAIADAATSALGRAGPWPAASVLPPAAWPTSEPRTIVYDDSGEIGPGAARIVVLARTPSAERAVSAARALGSPRGALVSRLAALDAPARLASVDATAHTDGGCLAATIDLTARDLLSDGPARIATAAALAREEVAVEIADAAAPDALSRALTLSASDPRDAGQREAWWSLAGRRPAAPGEQQRITLVVGVGATRDATDLSVAGRAGAIRDEIDRATLAWHAPVVESRNRVERGQGEAWLLVASPCGTWPEDADDAGAGAVVALAASAQAAERDEDARVEPFVAADGIGVLVHGGARPGETPEAHARRLADLAARSLAADATDVGHIARARANLLALASAASARAMGTLAAAIAPGHPSWSEPQGTLFGLASASDEAIALRAAAVRAGPLRLAMIANVDSAQAEAAERAVDRWVARRPGAARSCPSTPSLAPPRPGTYAVDGSSGAPSEAILAIPLPPEDDRARAAATWLAASLDGSEGPLARAVLATDPPSEHSPPSGATVFGSRRASALALHLVVPDDALDAAVAQARAVLDRLRQGDIHDEDRARASARLARATETAELDPRSRITHLWRGDAASPAPSTDDLRAFAATALRDDALVVIAVRPPRPVPSPRAAVRDSKNR